MDSWLTPNPVWSRGWCISYSPSKWHRVVALREVHPPPYPVPEVKPEDYRLCIEGLLGKLGLPTVRALWMPFLRLARRWHEGRDFVPGGFEEALPETRGAESVRVRRTEFLSLCLFLGPCQVVATLQCGGNRRSELDQIEKTSGIPWGFGAMSTAP